MKRYAEYKDSGVEWIGEIPSEWEVKKLKYVSDEPLMYGANESGDEDNFEYPRYIRITDIDENGDLRNDTFKSLSPDKATPYLIKKGDILFARSGASVGKTYFHDSDEKSCFAGYLIKLSTNLKIVVPKYIYYIAQTDRYENWIKESTIQATIQNVSAEKYKNFYITFPPLQTQRVITDYLDRKAAGINALIADKQKLIDLLREKLQATIYETVTKGIDKTAKMKGSGIEWIGEIPAHWDVLSNHQLFVERNQKNTDADAELLSVTKYLGVILQSRAQELRLATIAPADSTEGYKIVKKGDLVMNIMRAKDGSYGISSYDGVISPAYCIYQARKRCNPQFLYYLFKTPKYVQIFKCYSTGIAEHRMRLYPENFNKIPAILPPIAEQDEIVKKLDAESKQIDEVIALTEQQIEKLKEYRQCIISEVVTGKVVV